MITNFKIFENNQNIWYHGSYSDFNEFKVKKGTLLSTEYNSPIFLSKDKEFAGEYSRSKGGILYTVNVNVDNIFNFKKLPSSLDILYYEDDNIKKPDYDYDLGISLLEYIEDNFDSDKVFIRGNYPEQIYNDITSGDYSTIEQTWFYDWLKENGFDGAYVIETEALNLFIFDPKKIDILKKEY